MFIQVAVETPQHLTKRQRELLEEFESEGKGHARGSPETEGFFAKVKEFFDSGKCKRIEVFWFFFSKKNSLSKHFFFAKKKQKTLIR